MPETEARPRVKNRHVGAISEAQWSSMELYGDSNLL
jgi:hypothetical protein